MSRKSKKRSKPQPAPPEIREQCLRILVARANSGRPGSLAALVDRALE